MAKNKLSEQEWETFLGLADRLGVDLRIFRRRMGGFMIWRRLGMLWDGQ